MIHILIPSCGHSEFFKDSYYPKSMIEVNGKPMIQCVVENYQSIQEKKFIFLFLQYECNKFHTDHAVKLMTEESEIIRLKEITGGALCTALMAIEQIDSEIPLIIGNNDQIIEEEIADILRYFQKVDADCGVACFESIHPRWSYVRMKGEQVVETAEKRPISKLAIAGFYYFKKGQEFVEAAKRAIKKGRTEDGKYYLSMAINEMILMNKRVCCYRLEEGTYHSFYSPEMIQIYEKQQGKK